MKKLVLTSLLAVFAATGANAAINDNPMYRPDQGKFYSVTDLMSNTEYADTWVLNEKFGYGITDRASIYVSTALGEGEWFDTMEWGMFEVGADYRLLDDMNWKVDAYGSYAVGPVWGDRVSFAHGIVAGTGNPYFTTDTASVLRATEMRCDVILKGTQVDGVYDKDPKKYPDAVRFDKITFDEAIKRDLRVMDPTALTLARDNNMPILVFKISEQDAFLNAIKGEGKYTIISNE